MAEAKRDQNRIPTLIGVTDDDGVTPKLVYVADATNRLKVDAVVTSGLSSQTGVIDNEAVDAADAGVLILGTDGTNYQVLATDATGNLQVDIVSGSSAGTEYTEGGTDATITGVAMLWEDTSDTLRSISAAKPLPISVATIPSHAVTNAGTFAVTETTPLTGFATSAKQLADGHAVTVDNIITNEVFVRGGGTAGSPQAGEVLAVQGISGGTAMSVTESSPLTGFATSAKQLADGHNVTIDNSTGGSAVNIQDGGNTITVDGSVALTNDSLIGAGDPTIDSYAHIAINLNAGADQVLVASAADKQIWVYGFGFTLSVAGTVSFQDESDTAVTGIMDFAANSGMAVSPSGNFAMPIWKLATDKDLEVDVVDAAIDGWISYAIVSV